MKQNNVKHLDLELLFFFLCVSCITFFLYIVKHPLFSMNILNINKDGINSKALFMAYLPDLIIFLSILIPYISLIISLLIVKFIKKVKIPDNVMVILFFPLLSFFTKGMSVLNIYIEKHIFELFYKIFRNNYAFFSFIFIGPLIIIIHKIIVNIRKNVV